MTKAPFRVPTSTRTPLMSYPPVQSCADDPTGLSIGLSRDRHNFAIAGGGPCRLALRQAQDERGDVRAGPTHGVGATQVLELRLVLVQIEIVVVIHVGLVQVVGSVWEIISLLVGAF